MKALHIGHILPEMSLYVDFTYLPLNDPPTFCAQAGRDLLSYLSDITSDADTLTITMLAIRGLLDAPDELLSPITSWADVTQSGYHAQVS